MALEKLPESLFINYDTFWLNSVAKRNFAGSPLSDTLFTSFSEAVINKMIITTYFGTYTMPCSIFYNSKVESVPIDFFERTVNNGSYSYASTVNMRIIDDLDKSSLKSQEFNLTNFTKQPEDNAIKSIYLPDQIYNRGDRVFTFNISSKYMVWVYSGRTSSSASKISPGDYSAERGYIYNQVD